MIGPSFCTHCSNSKCLSWDVGYPFGFVFPSTSFAFLLFLKMFICLCFSLHFWFLPLPDLLSPLSFLLYLCCFLVLVLFFFRVNFFSSLFSSFHFFLFDFLICFLLVPLLYAPCVAFLCSFFHDHLFDWFFCLSAYWFWASWLDEFSLTLSFWLQFLLRFWKRFTVVQNTLKRFSPKTIKIQIFCISAILCI